MRKKLLLLLAAIAVVFSLASCSDDTDASKADIDEPKVSGRVLPEDYEARVPDTLTIYRNTDAHPTINKLCIEGVAFRTVSSTHSPSSGSVVRVPEWDETCPGYDPSRPQFPTGPVVVGPSVTTTTDSSGE